MLPALLLLMTVNASCESLQTLVLPETTILSATLVPDGPFTPPSAAGFAPVPCSATGR